MICRHQRALSEGALVITVESNNNQVECIAYKGRIPVGAGIGPTTAGIANVAVLIAQKQGVLTLKCL